MSFFLELIFFPLFAFLWGVFVVNPQEEILITHYGRLVRVVRSQGLNWHTVFGRNLIRISTKTQTIDIKKTTVVDSNGNPIIGKHSSTYTYQYSLFHEFSTRSIRSHHLPSSQLQKSSFRSHQRQRIHGKISQNISKYLPNISERSEDQEKQATATLKRVCSRYPYESKDGVSLQTEADQVAREMIEALQSKADLCGVLVSTYELADLQYAPG